MKHGPTQTERRLRLLAWLLLVMLLAVLAWQWRHGSVVSANMLELIPRTNEDRLQRLAQERVDTPLTNQLLILVGAAKAQQAASLASDIGQQLEDARLFDSVQAKLDVDIPLLREHLLAGRIAMLPAADRQLLSNDPQAFIARRASQLLDPFLANGVVPLQDDFLGLANRVEQVLKPATTVRLDLASGTLQAESQGRQWALVLAHVGQGAFDQAASSRVAELLADVRRYADAHDGEILATGGMLYSAAGAAQAKRESLELGLISAAGTLFLLALALRRARALLAFIPCIIGIAAGVAACVAVFGHVHAMTLAIGISLLGVAIDFPMHWLGKSYGVRNWDAWGGIRLVRTGLSISLTTTLIGYVALAFTPFPALQQTAVFSVAGLLAAYLSTVLLLPGFMSGWQPRPWPALSRLAQIILGGIARTRDQPGPAKTLFILFAFLALLPGLSNLNTRDDIRQWLGSPPDILAQSRSIAEITGVMPTSQFFLVRARDEDTLITVQFRLAERLDTLVARGELLGYDALSQIAVPAMAQDALRQRLLALRDAPLDSAYFKPLTDLGLPRQELVTELGVLAETPSRSLAETLASPLAARWRPLWLGRHEGASVGLVTLQGLASVDAISEAGAGLPGVTLVDRTGALNQLFTDTRLEAVELKAASYIVAGLLLWLTLGAVSTWRILAVPLAATLCTVAVLGYAGQSLTLFSLFGLLLVSALGMDYAIFMREGVGGPAACLVGILLGASTTLLSFGVLISSATPAISSFGLAVSVGILFSVIFAAWVRPLGKATLVDTPTPALGADSALP
ncbi:FIG021862: membrane protein, exporter [plant metagenome]|uniref:FIG021862: membrane protein, exporter n=1 Tax=plant metagenome TaxID=1297885 RepID=A0A484U824_9ZZZZ